jgi:hypothetical protein
LGSRFRFVPAFNWPDPVLCSFFGLLSGFALAVDDFREAESPLDILLIALIPPPVDGRCGVGKPGTEDVDRTGIGITAGGGGGGGIGMCIVIDVAIPMTSRRFTSS